MGTDRPDGNDDDVQDSREYVHDACGEDTIVSGGDFRSLADPLSVAERTYCAHCEDHFPLAEFRWADSRERISEYRERYKALVPRTGRFLAGPPGCLLPILGGLALGIGGGIALVPAVGTLAGWVAAGVGGLIGAFVGLLIQANWIEPAIYRQAFGTSDSRQLR